MAHASPVIRAFIQARMSSTRFPGKVLAPLGGRPLIGHVIERVARVIDLERIVVATTSSPADTPLISYLSSLGVTTFQGPEADVFERFRLCLEQYPCDWFFRVCADSPMLDDDLLHQASLLAAGNDADVITNVWPRSYPHGQSVELIRAATFSNIDGSLLSSEDKEHVTRYLYQSGSFSIFNIDSGKPSLAEDRRVVDTVDDLLAVEALLVNLP